jgi:hypothetical protein
MTYPLPESVSGGVMSVAANAVGVGFLFVAPSISGPAMNAIMIAVVLGAAVAMPFVKEEYHRQKHEEQEEEERRKRIDGGIQGSGDGAPLRITQDSTGDDDGAADRQAEEYHGEDSLTSSRFHSSEAAPPSPSKVSTVSLARRESLSAHPSLAQSDLVMRSALLHHAEF